MCVQACVCTCVRAHVCSRVWGVPYVLVRTGAGSEGQQGRLQLQMWVVGRRTGCRMGGLLCRSGHEGLRLRCHNIPLGACVRCWYSCGQGGERGRVGMGSGNRARRMWAHNGAGGRACAHSPPPSVLSYAWASGIKYWSAAAWLLCLCPLPCTTTAGGGVVWGPVHEAGRARHSSAAPPVTPCMQERLHRCFFIDAPSVFGFLFGVRAVGRGGVR